MLYDNQDLLAACRAYWLLTIMGCPNVHIMNGTFGKWKFEEREINFYESEDLWHKLAEEKKLRRKLEFDQKVDQLNDNFKLDMNFVADEKRINRILRLNKTLVL